jgi:hypothetical protein
MITDALNEAKDNVRFLENLRKVIEPLYTEAPIVIAETMPALMNSMKMILTLSRHYGYVLSALLLLCSRFTPASDSVLCCVVMWCV